MVWCSDRAPVSSWLKALPRLEHMAACWHLSVPVTPPQLREARQCLYGAPADLSW